MSDPKEEFENNLSQISEGKANFSVDEQYIIDRWLEKLSEPDTSEESQNIKNKYARALANMVTVKKELSPPFSETPPDGDIISLSKRNFQMRRLPCRSKTSQGTRSTTKVRRSVRNLSPDDFYVVNDFEDPEEMAKAIARSKGQSFAEFVISISRHTADFGQELRRAMKLETNSFREYVDHVLTQRIKDLTEVLNEEQNRELQRIKKDIDKWQLELSHVKKRIQEMIPEFDLDEYKNDKNYLKKLFTIKPELSEDDSFKKWKEENYHRLKWLNDRTFKIARCNEQYAQTLSNVKCETAGLEASEETKQQDYVSQINCLISEYQSLQSERDKLRKVNNQLQSQLKGRGF